MLVSTRPGIKPKCTRHRALMNAAELGQPTELTIKAYKCSEAGCTRAYSTSQGYFDIMNDGVMVLQMEQLDCPSCGLPLYADSFHADGTETWRCAQMGCKYSSQIVRAPEEPAQG